MTISVVILTFNAEATIDATLRSVSGLSDDIHVVDSGSTDATLEIVARFTDKVTSHPFESYGAQRNWAMDNLDLRHDWQLHLDADERLTPELAGELADLSSRGFPGEAVGYFVPRLTWFLGRPIRHGGLYPSWHMRLFRRGRGRCETRKYDQHFYVDGPSGRLRGAMIDDMRMSISEWVTRHNRWADAEADELEQPSYGEGVIRPDASGDLVQRKRAQRERYNRAPLFARAVAFFLYRYVLRLGFLDGAPGLVFFGLGTLWFRFLVDAKLYERRLQRARSEIPN
jgi:glycosyltransferase involved in cell wall biosynthesis